MTKKEVAADQGQFADLFRDIRGMFTKGRPLKIVLRHLRIGSKEGTDSDVTTWEKDHFEEKDPNEFAQEVVTDVLEDVKIFPPSMQRYGLFFWWNTAPQHGHRMFIMVKGGGPTDSGDVFANEGPDQEGRTAQLMRHDEGFARLMLQGVKTTLDSKDRTIERYETLIDKLTGNFVPMVQALQDVMDRKDERELHMERTRKVYNLIDQGGEALGKFGPILAAYKLKDKNPELAQMILKASTNPATEIVKAFMGEIEKNPEAAPAILDAVNKLPNGRAIIAALSQLYEAEKIAAQAKQQQPQPNGNGKAE